MTADSRRACVLTDGHAGNVRQAQALARALGRIADEIVLAPRAPWRWTAPRALPRASRAFGPAFRAAWDLPPALAIGCGRQGALATRLLRERGSRAIQILDPRIDPSHWDVVIAPAHDGLAGPNVLSLLGSLNPVDDAWLADARTAFPAFATLPSPRTAWLIGGGSAHYALDAAASARLLDAIDASAAAGSLMITASRRTSADLMRALGQRFASSADSVVWCGPADGPNPYAGMLAWADRIACTPDSVNMLSEACATAAPVHVFEPARVEGRPRLFVEALLARGRVRALSAALSPFDAQPLRETARIAADVRMRLAL